MVLSWDLPFRSWLIRHLFIEIQVETEDARSKRKKMSDSIDLMDVISASLRSTLDEIYQRLTDCNFRMENPELVMFTVALLKAMGREGRGDRPTQKLLRLTSGQFGAAERSIYRLMRWRPGEIGDAEK